MGLSICRDILRCEDVYVHRCREAGDSDAGSKGSEWSCLMLYTTVTTAVVVTITGAAERAAMLGGRSRHVSTLYGQVHM